MPVSVSCPGLHSTSACPCPYNPQAAGAIAIPVPVPVPAEELRLLNMLKAGELNRANKYIAPKSKHAVDVAGHADVYDGGTGQTRTS